MAMPGARVRCCSRRPLLEALERVAESLCDRLQGERQREEARRIFKTAVQENILINGMLWHEVSEEDELRYGNDIKNLDDDLGECIKETSSKRKQFPRKIVGHLAKTMKAERELLKLYQVPANPQMKLEIYPEQVSKEMEVMKITSTISQDTSNAMKDLPAFMEKAEGVLQTLSFVPVMKQSQTNKAVFSTHTEMEFQNNEEQGFPSGKKDVTPVETDNKLLRNRNSQKSKTQFSVNHKYPKRRLHLDQ
ncbi:kinetochore-associated protein NSL1 homolog [Amblyraja radiata]|uniref:kinetochore-associated protein NSL1 homolog n=1 Tax=Amblyraja radiata TaxID=386614 RepID=UPI00140312ED|nr:kinetochore-associated protein NSL1 homolog [Amblyraja radiata]XP_032881209.1 kinetochore-associated protein NSL1 homolog [Amblyraja radiata]XP_055495746.1 kinetochore-associated protein NSL1 homolog [Leucoraja erinacea]